MRTRISPRSIVVCSAAALAVMPLVGCSRKQAAETPAAATTPPAGAASQPPATTGATRADGWPEGVLHAYYWQCDGGLNLVMKNLVKDDAVSLELHEGTRKLPRVPSASGATYADESIEFWTKGGTATYEHKPAPPVVCKEVRARSLVEDARARGVLYRGSGNEPGWTVEIGPGKTLSYLTDYGETRHEYGDATATGDPSAGGRAYSAARGNDSIRVTVTREACADDMSGASFDHSFRVEVGGQVYRGCGERLGPS